MGLPAQINSTSDQRREYPSTHSHTHKHTHKLLHTQTHLHAHTGWCTHTHKHKDWIWSRPPLHSLLTIQSESAAFGQTIVHGGRLFSFSYPSPQSNTKLWDYETKSYKSQTNWGEQRHLVFWIKRQINKTSHKEAACHLRPWPACRLFHRLDLTRVETFTLPKGPHLKPIYTMHKLCTEQQHIMWCEEVLYAAAAAQHKAC